jgi:HlyD family secretion protein
VVEQPVRVGLRALDRIEIADGLAVGDTVLADPLSAQPGVRARAARDGEAAGRAGAGAGAGAGAASAMGAAGGGSR